MAANMALKRARKVQRRKQVAAEKRRAEALDASLPAQVRAAAHMPIQYCFLTESLFDIGMGTLVLARGATRHHVALSSFLLDVFCLGIKDVTFQSIEGELLEMYMDALEGAAPMVRAEPSYARKLLRDLAEWSQSVGFAPHRDFAAVEQMFGDVNADACDAIFRFGRDGKPVYIPGMNDTAALVRARIERLRQHLGDDGFEVEAAAE